MSKNEYGEPWLYRRDHGSTSIQDSDGSFVVMPYTTSGGHCPQLERLAHCVNALAGVPDEVVEKGLDAIIEWERFRDDVTRPIITEEQARTCP